MHDFPQGIYIASWNIGIELVVMLAVKRRPENSSKKVYMRVLLICITALVLVAFSNVPTASAYTQNSDYINVIIYDAYYGDLDQGGVDNDIHVTLLFDLGYYAYYEIYYDISLTLPSGLTYTYRVHVLAWYEHIRIDNEFLNHATEAGDYKVEVVALMVFPSVILDSASLVFDPPGGDGGGDPVFRVA